MPLVHAPHRRSVRLAWLALTLAVAACTTTATPSPIPTVVPTLAPTSSPQPSSTASPTAAATAVPTVAPIALCAASDLSASIVAGSASHASGGLVGFIVSIKNVAKVACTLHQLDRVRMVDKNGVTMIAGAAPAASAVLYLNAGFALQTTIQARNFCGGVPVEPVTVEFVLAGGGGTLKAKPLATDPGSIVPSCFQGGVAGSISMSEWGP